MPCWATRAFSTWESAAPLQEYWQNDGAPMVDQTKLDATRSRSRYSFALRMNSSSAIVAALAPYIGLRRTPETINKLFALYQQITPQDIRAIARQYFTPNNRTIVTLTSNKGANN